MKQALILIVTLMCITSICNAQPTDYTPPNSDSIVYSVYIVPSNKLDTVPSSILISHKSPSFGHGIDGYCVYKNDKCAGIHYKVWRKRMILIGPEYVIWGCKRRDKK